MDDTFMTDALNDDLLNRFNYHPPKDDRTRIKHEIIRKTMFNAAVEVAHLCPDGREKSLAFTKLEEAMMWANAAIARNPVPEQEAE